MEECEDRYRIYHPHDKGKFKRKPQKWTGELVQDTILVPKVITKWEYKYIPPMDSLNMTTLYIGNGEYFTTPTDSIHLLPVPVDTIRNIYIIQNH
jgi:hypothetical protein